MNEQRKRELFFEEMVGKGEARSKLAPLLYKFCWRMGFNIAPPLFATAVDLFIVNMFGGLLWGLAMWAIIWRDTPELALVGAFFFGFSMTVVTYLSLERRRKKLDLNGSWEDYQPHRS